MLSRLIAWLIRRNTFKGEAKNRVLAALLSNIGALPIQDIIKFDPQGTVYINDKKLDIEQAISFKESADALKESVARKIIREQIKYLAVKYGIHDGLSTETIMFSKAAFWIMEEEDKLIERLAPQK
jgi:hypothetical protein